MSLYPQHLPVQSLSRQVAVTVVLMTNVVATVTWAPDDGWRYHPKHVEQFTDINKLFIVASWWTIIGISNRMFNEIFKIKICWHLSVLLANRRWLVKFCIARNFKKIKDQHISDSYRSCWEEFYFLWILCRCVYRQLSVFYWIFQMFCNTFKTTWGKGFFIRTKSSFTDVSLLGSIEVSTYSPYYTTLSAWEIFFVT